MAIRYAGILLMILLVSCEKSIDPQRTFIKYFGDAYEDIGYSLAKTDDGYVIAGQLTEIQRDHDNYITGSGKRLGIIRTGPDGNIIWQKFLGNRLSAAGSKVIYDAGKIICTGYAIDSITLQKDIFVAKMDIDGNNLVQNIYKGEGNQYGNDIIKTSEGYLVLGTTDVKREPLTESTGNSSGKKDILLLRIGESLEMLYYPVAKGYPGNDEGIVLKQDNNGGYIVTGTTDRSEKISDIQDGNNIFLFRVNTDGSTTEFRIIGGVDDEAAADMEVLSNGYIIAGTKGNEGSVQKGYVWNISSDIYAEPITEHIIDLSITDPSFSIKAICRYKTNSLLMAGQIKEAASSRMLIIATDSEGNMIDGKIRIEGGTGNQVAFDVMADDEEIVAVGKNSYENNSMISLFKFAF